MKVCISVSFLVSVFGFLCCVGVVAQSASSLPDGQPDKEGVSSAAVLSFIERLEKDIDAVHSFMILRHGKRIAQGWWTPMMKLHRSSCIRSVRALPPRPLAWRSGGSTVT